MHEQPGITESPESGNECEIAQESKDKFPHVLIIEDHGDIREFIGENLKDCFYVEQADNGKSGLESALKNIPDLVITDIVMPEMDGIELCQIIKTDERTSHIPVVILTGKSGIDDRLKGLDTGADAYLTKPFNIKELRLQVSKLIEQRQKLRERFTRDLRLEPRDIAVTSADEKFINRAMEIIEKNIGNSEFEVRQFEEEMFMSRMQLFRKIKALTNQTPGDFIRTIRLKRAASLIKQNFGNIAQITYEVGFNNPSYFAKCFKDLYGELPSDYMKNHHL
jgi:YesN/AraC family two-component response regulator